MQYLSFSLHINRLIVVGIKLCPTHTPTADFNDYRRIHTNLFQALPKWSPALFNNRMALSAAGFVAHVTSTCSLFQVIFKPLPSHTHTEKEEDFLPAVHI